MSIFNLTNTIISGSSDISCVAYNDIIRSRTNAIIKSISAGKIGPIRGQPRRALPFVNNNVSTSTIDIAGATFNLNFPSECQLCSTLNQNDNCDFCRTPDKSNCFTCKLYQTLLKKKGYIFTNSNNKNVVSGPIQWRTKNGVITILQFGGTSGGGLTKKQQLSNVGKGLMPDGKPSKKFGVQSYDGIRLYSNSNIYSDTIPTNNGVISVCKNNISIYPSLGKYFTKNSNIINSSSFIYNARFTIVNNIIYVLIFNQSTSNYEIRSNNIPIITSKIDCWKLEYYTEEPLQAIAVDKNNTIYFSIADNGWCGDVYERTTVNTRKFIGYSCRLTLLKMPSGQPDIPLDRAGGKFTTMTPPIITLTEVDMTNFANNNKYFFTTHRDQYNIHYYKHNSNYTSNLPTQPPLYKTIANPKINGIIINIVQVECSDRYLYALSYILSGTIFRWDLDTYPLDNNNNNNNNHGNWEIVACKVNLNEFGQSLELGSWSYRPLMVLSIDNDRNEHIFVENNNKIIRVSDTPICKLILDYNINITTDLKQYYNDTSHIITGVNITTGVNNYSDFDLIYNARFTIVHNVIYVLIFNQLTSKYEIRSCFLGDEIMVKSKINGWRLEYSTTDKLQAIAVDKNNTIYFSIADNGWCGDVYERTTVNTRKFIGYSCRLTLLKMPSGQPDIPLDRAGGKFTTMTPPIITLTEVDMTNFANNNKYFFTTHRDQYNIHYYKHNSNYTSNLPTQPPLYKTIANPKINGIIINIVQVECSDRYLYALSYILSGTIFRWDLDTYPLDNNNNNNNNSTIWKQCLYNINIGEFGQDIDSSIGSWTYRPLMVLFTDSDENDQIFIEHQNMIIQIL